MIYSIFFFILYIIINFINLYFIRWKIGYNLFFICKDDIIILYLYYSKIFLNKFLKDLILNYLFLEVYVGK